MILMHPEDFVYFVLFKLCLIKIKQVCYLFAILSKSGLPIKCIQEETFTTLDHDSRVPVCDSLSSSNCVR